MALKYSEAVAITSFIKLQNKSALFIPRYILCINLNIFKSRLHSYAALNAVVSCSTKFKI